MSQSAVFRVHERLRADMCQAAESLPEPPAADDLLATLASRARALEAAPSAGERVSPRLLGPQDLRAALYDITDLCDQLRAGGPLARCAALRCDTREGDPPVSLAAHLAQATSILARWERSFSERIPGFRPLVARRRDVQPKPSPALLLRRTRAHFGKGPSPVAVAGDTDSPQPDALAPHRVHRSPTSIAEARRWQKAMRALGDTMRGRYIAILRRAVEDLPVDARASLDRLFGSLGIAQIERYLRLFPSSRRLDRLQGVLEGEEALARLVHHACRKAADDHLPLAPLFAMPERSQDRDDLLVDDQDLIDLARRLAEESPDRIVPALWSLLYHRDRSPWPSNLRSLIAAHPPEGGNGEAYAEECLVAALSRLPDRLAATRTDDLLRYALLLEGVAFHSRHLPGSCSDPATRVFVQRLARRLVRGFPLEPLERRAEDLIGWGSTLACRHSSPGRTELLWLEHFVLTLPERLQLEGGDRGGDEARSERRSRLARLGMRMILAILPDEGHADSPAPWRAIPGAASLGTHDLARSLRSVATSLPSWELAPADLGRLLALARKAPHLWDLACFELLPRVRPPRNTRNSGLAVLEGPAG